MSLSGLLFLATGIYDPWGKSNVNISSSMTICVAFVLATAIMTPAALAANHHSSLAINENGFNSSEVCGKCHTQIFARWEKSMHSHSTSDPIFQASYMEAHYKSRGEAAKLCLRCHAPTTKVTHGWDLDVGVTSEGITCDFCHSIKSLTGDKENPFELDLGRTKYGPNKTGDVKQHDVAYSPLHSESEFCATCHEYQPGGVPVMTTYSEWKDSTYADEGKTCQSCHMPPVPGEIANNVVGERGPVVFSHDLAGSHSVEQLKKALDLKMGRIERKEGRMTIQVSLTNKGSGHRIPTGMPTRKLVLFCEVRVGGKVFKERIIYEKAIFDKENLELTSDADIMLGRGVSIAKDNRIYPRETRTESFTFYIPDTKRATVSVWIDYLYQPIIRQETEMRIEMNRTKSVSEGRH